MRYTVYFLEGTDSFVEKELLEKYPNTEILSPQKDCLVFESDIDDINSFRNLYSPLNIESEEKRINTSRREWRKEFVSAGINPSLAYVMCMCSNLQKNHIIYDPFCGSSVIPITAIKYFNVKRVLCSDISDRCIEKSSINFNNAYIESNRYILFKSDISKVRLKKQNIDIIISNLPFGIRTGNHKGNERIYIDLEKLSRKILRKRGQLILLTQEKVLLRKVFKKDYWNVKSIARINTGGLLPEIFNIERKESSM